ncbi:hypothetical protein [Stutzerimonas kirkiae]|uniref:hypothetical protein n=1 Tax=Stutzerimonas kirkiae TaxID=2211392 RepID=UPI0010385095|nr:hypothetical protein [Stutzerimonas kirkiae]
MKFAFIENRYKTIFWAELAKELRRLNCAVTWLVQNPVFSPVGEPMDTVFNMPFPSRSDLVMTSDAGSLGKARKADRYINYFGGSDRHYGYYKSLIKAWIDRERPDVVVGESTLFHELIVISVCRDRGIPYLHPSMPGYPGGRYSIYSYDSKETVGLNSKVPCDADCLAMAEAIRKRERIPDYMIPPTGREPERSHPLPRSMKDRLIILRGYVAGERYNTPAPWRKWLLDRQVQRRLKVWQQIASDKSLEGKGLRLALYPLQMQPEANLDVWGQEFRDQAKLVIQLADALPEGWHLRVKANPKSKYELSDGLLDVLRSHPKVSPIPLMDSMASVLAEVDLVCTVTGTVAVECVLSGKPLVQFGPSVVDHGSGCEQLRSAVEIADVARSIEANRYRLATDESRINLVRKLYATTFPGKVSDPVNLPSVMAVDNVRSVANTILEVAKGCV